MLLCKVFLFRIAYVYCCDTILDQNNKLTLEITQESLERVLKGKNFHRQSSTKSSSVKPSPAKSDTRGTMDTEGR